MSGIRWQEEKRRKGKPSSLVFEQTFCFSVYGYQSYQKQSTKPSPVDFFFQNCVGNLAVPEEKTYFFTSYRLSLARVGTMVPVFLSGAPSETHHLWTWKQLWSGPAHSL